MIIVDAYNVLGADGGEAGPLDLRGLVGLIAGSRLAGKRVVLVCDGVGRARMPGGRIGRIEVVYAGAGRDADSVIGEMIRGRGAGSLVVSSDRAVRAAARRAGAREISSDVFLAGLAAGGRGGATGEAKRGAGPRKRVPLGAWEVERWVEEFGLRASDLMDIAGAASAVREEKGAGAARAGARHGEAAVEVRREISSEARGAGEVWMRGIDPGELDMARWVDGVTRLEKRG